MSGWYVPTRRSLLALDWINFFLADVETGVGPFMATYFVSVWHWNPAQVGLILAAQKIASVLVQTPAGSFIDRTHSKKWLLSGASVVVGVGALLVALLKSVPGQIVNQMIVGVSVAVATPLIAAISLGMVGRQALGRRIGRNEAFNHAGNLLTALCAGLLGYAVGLQWIFYACGGLGLVCAAVALLIRSGDINDSVAREAPEKYTPQKYGQQKYGNGTQSPPSYWEVLAKPYVLSFAIVVVIFHIANAAMLPLVGEELSGRKGHASSVYMSACIVTAQLVMIPVAYTSGRVAHRLGRKPILLVAFAALVLRALLFSFSSNANYVVAVEALDGIGTGISGVLTVLIISDLAKGTSRFNFLQGAMQAGLSIGAFLGNLLGGLAAKSFGFPATFAGLACVALAGLVFFAAKVPETLRPSPGI